MDRELTPLLAAEEHDRLARYTAMKTQRIDLLGDAALEAAQAGDPEVRSWLRGALSRHLPPAQARLFQMGTGPLIPREEWPGLPAEPAETAVAADPPRPMTPVQRQARIKFLQDQRVRHQQELDVLFEQDAPEREKKNRKRKKIIGELLLALDEPDVSRVRALLDTALSEPKERRLFQLAGPGPLVPADGCPAPQATRAQAATKPPPRRRSASQRPDRSGRAGAPTARGAVGSRETDSARTEPLPPGVQGPISGWRPHRVTGQNSDSEAGGRKATWGAKLKGRPAVAALPAALVGREITVTDRTGSSWTTTITHIVRRDADSITVRDSGRPGRRAERSRRVFFTLSRLPGSAKRVSA
ncbi:MAG: hypothetical protein OXG04_09140 [Acidobacteria bacterium]|nr:hypothetical protein [Acidobacteriota bacterium]